MCKRCVSILLVSIFCGGCGTDSDDSKEGESASAKPAVKTSQQTPAVRGPMEFTMIVSDELDSEEFDSDELGEEKMFVVQQALSDGMTALYIADDHAYSSIFSHLFSFFTEGNTLADTAQERIKGILKDNGGSLKAKVCEEDSLEDRTDTLKEEGLTKGTLVLVRGADEWTTYMEDPLSDGFFDGYSVSSVKQGSDGFVERIWLSEYSSSSTSIREGEEESSVDVSKVTEELHFIPLIRSPDFSTQESLVNLEKYISILNRIQRDQFSLCNK